MHKKTANSILRDLMPNFKDSDIVFWTVSFDADGFSYVHHKLESALNAVRDFTENGLLELDDETRDAITNRVLDACVGNIDASGKLPFIELSIDNKIIHVRRLVLDKHNLIHKIVSDLYPIADDLNKKRIESLFQHSS